MKLKINISIILLIFENAAFAQSKISGKVSVVKKGRPWIGENIVTEAKLWQGLEHYQS